MALIQPRTGLSKFTRNSQKFKKVGKNIGIHQDKPRSALIETKEDAEAAAQALAPEDGLQELRKNQRKYIVPGTGEERLLFDFQEDGVNWMLGCWRRNRGCILADEMGLGKTVQTSVFFLVERFDRRGTEPFELFRSEFCQNSGTSA